MVIIFTLSLHLACSTNSTADMDKMVSIKGLVIRTTPVIPDMKTGMNLEAEVLEL